MAEIKETPAERAARVKREKSPLEILPDIERYAREGFSAISRDDLDIRFKAWGLYTQGNGQGVGGTEEPFFLLRTRIPGGQLWSHQARAIAELSLRYARSTLDITDRQNIQFHWLRIEDVPAVFRELGRVGISSQGTCGDFIRNITACPVAGIDAHEIYDTKPLVREVDRMLQGNPEFADLPRKFKITITGCHAWCTHPEINDIGLTAVRRRGRGSEVGFTLRVGGGLATRPHLARPLGLFITPAQVPGVVRAAASLFRDTAALRETRTKARLKFLFLDHGWDEERFRHELEARLGEKLPRYTAEQPPADGHRDHVGLHPQQQSGLSYAGFAIQGGRLKPEQLMAAADLADRYGDGRIVLTVQQNLVITGLRNERVDAFVQQAEAVGLSLDVSPFKRSMVACTGSQFCKLALTETKAFSAALAEDLDRRMPGFRELLKIHVNGCPNSCGQHWIADVGLQGVRLKEGGDGYEFFLGGGVARGADLARRVPYRVAAGDVPDALERLLAGFLREREEGESFQEFARRHTPAELRDFLAGETTAVERPEAAESADAAAPARAGAGHLSVEVES